MKAILKNIVLIVFLFVNTITNAQSPGFDDDVQDVPVDQWILPMFVFGAILIFFFMRRKQTLIN